eukprot:scaffold29515_cov81-Isochrysis_galbana.AAC.1
MPRRMPAVRRSGGRPAHPQLPRQGSHAREGAARQLHRRGAHHAGPAGKGERRPTQSARRARCDPHASRPHPHFFVFLPAARPLTHRWPSPAAKLSSHPPPISRLFPACLSCTMGVSGTLSRRRWPWPASRTGSPWPASGTTRRSCCPSSSQGMCALPHAPAAAPRASLLAQLPLGPNPRCPRDAAGTSPAWARGGRERVVWASLESDGGHAGWQRLRTTPAAAHPPNPASHPPFPPHTPQRLATHTRSSFPSFLPAPSPRRRRGGRRRRTRCSPGPSASAACPTGPASHSCCTRPAAPATPTSACSAGTSRSTRPYAGASGSPARTASSAQPCRGLDLPRPGGGAPAARARVRTGRRSHGRWADAPRRSAASAGATCSTRRSSGALSRRKRTLGCWRRSSCTESAGPSCSGTPSS